MVVGVLDDYVNRLPSRYTLIIQHSPDIDC